jgi:serine/threonine protein kinase
MSNFVPLIEGLASSYPDWRIETDTAAFPQQWVRFHHSHAAIPDSGWKIHVSAGLSSALSVLQKALPILLNEQLSFKVAASLDFLRALNWGEYGYSQIGKFVTVYPADDVQAVYLAAKLDEITSGLRGPVIPSDRPFRQKSLVHYRYGAFRKQFLQTISGASVPAMRQTNGTLVPDQRGGVGGMQPPSDPFVTSRGFESLKAEASALDDQFLYVSTLQLSARGSVNLCLDLVNGERRVVKQAGRDCLLDEYGRDARDRLRHESYILSRALPHSCFPTQFGLIEREDSSFLILECVAGQTLAAHMEKLAGRGLLPAPEQVVEWGAQLARALARLHSRMIIYRDLKPANIILTPEGSLRIVDFELAQVVSTNEPPFGVGTPGYFSMQQANRARPCVSDDVYAFGSLLFFLCTNIAPSRALAKPYPQVRLSLANPNLPDRLASLIWRCLQPLPKLRCADMAEIIACLAVTRCNRKANSFSAALPDATYVPWADERIDNHYAELAVRSGNTLCRSARRTADGVAWDSTRNPGVTISSRDLGTGSAGALLCLARLVQEFGVPKWLSLLNEGTRSLANVPMDRRSSLTGLYAGEAGVGVALLRAGQVLGSQELIDWALDCSHHISMQPFAGPDLLTGAAGRLRFHLMVWAATQIKDHLQHAIRAGHWLLDHATTSQDHMYWLLPQGYGELSGSACLGYARGAAGIADALLDLSEVAGEQRFLAATQCCTNWILSFAVPALEDGSGLCWPRLPGEMPRGAFWCHGASGIGRFLLHVFNAGLREDGLDLVSRVAETVHRGTRWADPTQCHGLSGNIEFLIDLYQSTNNPKHLQAARSLASILETFSREENGVLFWESDLPESCTPDYLFGYSGIALALTRLSSPRRLPHELSLMNFRGSSSHKEATSHETVQFQCAAANHRHGSHREVARDRCSLSDAGE